MQPSYKRILLKLSGEVLAGNNDGGMGFDFELINSVCSAIKKISEMGVEVGLVVGGGNFWRGRSGGNMDRTRADNIGMLATVMNSLALCDTLLHQGVNAKVYSAIEMNKIADFFVKDNVDAQLKKGEVCIFGAGTGNPYFSTDTCAALRAAEIGAEVVLKATNVDGVYDKDPNKYADAVKYEVVSHDEVIEKNIKVMDSAAFSLCRDNGINIIVFNLNDPENIVRAVCGEKIGTLVK